MADTDRPNYGNEQITRLIKEYVHDKVDRKMLYLYLVDGVKMVKIAEMFNLDQKTVRKHIRKQEKEVFKHLPG